MASVVAIGLIASACSSGSHGPCTAIGADDGVEVGFDDVGMPASGELSITACVEGRCGTQAYHATRLIRVAEHGLFVAVPNVPVDSDVTIAVRIAANSRKVFAGSTVAHTRKFQPNGPDCEPTVWHARVVAHGTAQLAA